MPWKRRIVTGTLLAALTIGAGGCASAARTSSPTSSVMTPAPGAQGVASQETTASIQRAVAADANQIMADVVASPVQTSSNPYDYVGVSPRFKVLVARGTPAVEAIAREIETSKDNGLREYLLAIAAAQILGESDANKGWSTGKEWAIQYRSTH